MNPVVYLLQAAGGWQELNQRKNQSKYRNFLFLFFAGYFFLFPSLSASPTILKESGKHYFVIRGSFSLHTCCCMTSQRNGIQVLLNNIVMFKLWRNCSVETLSICTERDKWHDQYLRFVSENCQIQMYHPSSAVFTECFVSFSGSPAVGRIGIHPCAVLVEAGHRNGYSFMFLSL